MQDDAEKSGRQSRSDKPSDLNTPKTKRCIILTGLTSGHRRILCP
jgi:hypothetical protein